MVELNLIHFIYIIMLLVVIMTMVFKKDVVLPCIFGLFLIGLTYSGSIVKAIQIIYNSLIAASTQLLDVIVIISLVVAMSNALKDVGADDLMLTPIKKIMINDTTAFWGLGFMMLLFSWFIWPSPAVALIGAIMLPAAVKAGLSPIWGAVAMSLFGHGVGLSSDYFIQGAPSIVAKSAGTNTYDIINASLPLWLTMSIVTVTTAYILMLRDKKKNKDLFTPSHTEENDIVVTKKTTGSYVVAIITPIAFIINIIIMFKYQLKGGDATALVGGTAVILMCIASIVQHNFVNSFEKVKIYLKEGFVFGIKIFAPVIVIGAVFFLGSEETAKVILGENATGLLNDIGLYISNKVTLMKGPVVVSQAIIGGITGLDGSGFSGLPLVGSLAQTFSSAMTIDKNGLAALGQLTAIWVGGGTLVPWAVIPVAAICNVDPIELAKKNAIPVLAGFTATIIVAILIL